MLLHRLRSFGLLLCATILMAVALPAAAHEGETVDPCSKDGLYCPVQLANSLSIKLAGLASPNLSAPQPPTPPPAPAVSSAAIVTYDIATRGTITASLSEFKTQVDQTLNDPRGWSRLGVAFNQVSSGGQFTVVLSEASQIPTFSSDCDTTYSCTVGRYVIINQDRWLNATPSWNSAGGTLRDYRHMVVNHETGHWLGHGHQTCPAAGQAAPVMQQQSIDLQGCTFNPWPLSSELWSTRLGI
jgi:hypothetical protein